MTPFPPEKTIFKYVTSAMQLQEDGAGVRCQEKQVSGIFAWVVSGSSHTRRPLPVRPSVELESVSQQRCLSQIIERSKLPRDKVGDVCPRIFSTQALL
ncbi:MAG: hypothetical protein C4B58_03595 [Deltaproteobacteria bacterium]|nr:MAG: hypothetical protein C4B58_03595 [Deltaproteobacteria bacterium]